MYVALPHADHQNIIDLRIVSLPFRDLLLQGILLLMHGLILNFQKQFFEACTHKSLVLIPPFLIYKSIREQIKISLRQHGGREEAKDGIDMAVCVIDTKSNIMQFAGANRPMYLIRGAEKEAELIEFKPDRMPIGYYQGKEKSFSNYEIELEQGDTFYLFSDGFVDQKGGGARTKDL